MSKQNKQLGLEYQLGVGGAHRVVGAGEEMKRANIHLTYTFHAQQSGLGFLCPLLQYS